MNDRNKPRVPITSPKTAEVREGSVLTADELAMLEGREDASSDEFAALEGREQTKKSYVVDNSKRMPDWVILPAELKLPAGRTVGYMRFRSIWTDDPARGDRQCVVWNLSVHDERMAIKRARGDGVRVIAECSQQMIRAIDGVMVDWTGSRGVGNVEQFWEQIGARCRMQIQNYYMKTHALTEDEQVDFFANCIDVRTG